MAVSDPHALSIVVDDLSGTEIAALLEAHLKHCQFHSPPGSVHALDIDGLRKSGITFWSARLDGELVGCIALHEIDAAHAEIKSMHVTSRARGAGVARKMVAHLLTKAQQRGYHRLSLETGTMEGFRAARALYEGFGFKVCPPFAQYFEDPNSVCMTKQIS